MFDDTIESMEPFRLPPDTMKALRRMAEVRIPPETMNALRQMGEFRVPPETMNALRQMAEFRVPRETMEAFRKAATVPPETSEAFRKAVTIPPETIEAMRRAVTIPPETIEAMHQAVTIPRETTDALRRLAAEVQIPALDPSIWEALVEASRRFREMWEHAMPSNWTDFDAEDLTATIERVRATGYTLVWVPRAEIVREVLAVDESETAAVLLARRDDVLDDAALCLSEVTARDLVVIREGIEEAIEALRQGLVLAAQALGAVAFTSEIHELFGMSTKASRKRMLEKDPEDVPLGQLRLRTIFVASAKALDEFRPDRAVPVRHEFNRHNSAHRLTREQWSEANALSGIMLATSLLREMQYWYGIDSA
jgi:hypothetical protein